MKKRNNIAMCLLLVFMMTSAIGCASNNNENSDTTTTVSEKSSTGDANSSSSTGEKATNDSQSSDDATQSVVISSDSDVFTNRDLEQEADLTDATNLTLTSGSDLTITEEGVYVLTGTVTDVTIVVEAAEDAKVQLVLDKVSITNTDAPAIYVKKADKVFVTTTNSENTLAVTGTYVADGETNLDAAIFSKSDLTLNGLGTIDITSTNGNGISGKDDLKITGGTYNITSQEDAIEANDSIAICDGTFDIQTSKDALHCEYDENDKVGSIYISGGDFTIDAGDDGIQATTIAQIEGGTIHITKCVEGIEGTYVLINGGAIDITSSDDGINASNKSTAFDVLIEINDGDITIVMGSGDTDAVDANGDIVVNGGNMNITAQTSSFDYDGTGVINGGTVIVNGSQITTMPTQMMGGGQGGFGGNRGGFKK